MDRKALLRLVLVLVPVYLGLLLLSLKFGSRYLELLLPLYRWELAQLAPDYAVRSLDLARLHGEEVVALTVRVARYLVVEGRVLPPGGDINASTLAGNALQHPIVIFSLLLSWPRIALARRPVLILLGLPLLLLVELVDVPLVLLGSIRDLLLANLAPGTYSLLVGWMNFLNGGGRLALSLAAALIAIAAYRRLFRG